MDSFDICKDIPIGHGYCYIACVTQAGLFMTEEVCVGMYSQHIASTDSIISVEASTCTRSLALRSFWSSKGLSSLKI